MSDRTANGRRGTCRAAVATAIAVGAAVVAFGTVGCDSNGERMHEKRKGGEMAVDDEVTAGGPEEEAEEEAAGQEVGPAGPDSIPHGGITSVPDDPQLVSEGERVFKEKGCPACHKMHERQIGPALAGVTERREPEWIARMIQHPDQMLREDPTAQELLQEYGSRMTNQQVTPEETRAIMAYLGSVEPKEGAGDGEAPGSSDPP